MVSPGKHGVITWRLLNLHRFWGKEEMQLIVFFFSASYDNWVKCMKLRNLNLERQRKVSRLTGKVKERGRAGGWGQIELISQLRLALDLQSWTKSAPFQDIGRGKIMIFCWMCLLVAHCNSTNTKTTHLPRAQRKPLKVGSKWLNLLLRITCIRLFLLHPKGFQLPSESTGN